MTYFGAYGFSYGDCVGGSYPLGVSRRERLTYYARESNTCEANPTCYASPEPYSLEAAVEKTGRPLSLPTIIGMGRQSVLSANCG